MCQHAGHFDDAAELHLAPTAADARRSQCAHEVLRGTTQLILPLADVLDEGPKSGAGFEARLLAFRELLIHLGQRVADGLDQLIQCRLALIDLAERILLDVAELLIGELEKLLGAGTKGRAGQGIE